MVLGINLLTLLWTDGERYIPIDYRIYDKANDGLSKNDHFRAMLQTAHKRGFEPECVIFDSYASRASLPNLKFIREGGWGWLTRLEHNRQVNPDRKKLVALNQVDISETGLIVHLKGYGLIKVFKIVATDGNLEYWASNDLQMVALLRLIEQIAGSINPLGVDGPIVATAPVLLGEEKFIATRGGGDIGKLLVAAGHRNGKALRLPGEEPAAAQ